MRKTLRGMSLQELWDLFPIFLSPHKETWEGYFRKEALRIRRYLPSSMVFRLSHIGSTAIPTIQAKPIVDILLEVNEEADLTFVQKSLQEHGYRWMSSSQSRLDGNRGYTVHGFSNRVFHLHVRLRGDNDELYFRDYLLNHPSTAKEYEAIKLSLCSRFKHDRDAYTDAKGPFIRHYTEIAKKEYVERYR